MQELEHTTAGLLFFFKKKKKKKKLFLISLLPPLLNKIQNNGFPLEVTRETSGDYITTRHGSNYNMTL